MKQPKIIAVGSSPLVAREIATILSPILSPLPQLKTDTAATGNICQPAKDTFYVCANTQGTRLQNIVPQEQLFILRLQPTTRFFLDIAKIPAGETVYIFNNLLPYAKLLMQECQELGIDKLNFRPLAFEEMPEETVCQELSRAKWLIGVSPFVGKEILFSDRYRSSLRPDLKVIPGRRTASVASASRFLAALAHFYQRELQQEKLPITTSAAKQSLASQTDQLTRQLQQASLEIIKQQINGPADEENIAAPANLPKEGAPSPSMSEALKNLNYLVRRIERLAAAK